MTRRTLAALAAVVAAAFLAGATSATAIQDQPVDAASTIAPGPTPSDGYVAPPPLPIDCTVPPELCAIGERAATDLHYPWATLGYSLRLAPAPDDWHAGVTRHEERVIELYVRPDTDPRSLARTFAHEIGHAIHTVCPDRMEAWRARRALGEVVPDHVPAPHDYDSVAEDFAEAFSMYLGYGASRSSVGLPVTREWLQRNADLFVPCAPSG